jgi:hypothetical protein
VGGRRDRERNRACPALARTRDRCPRHRRRSADP